MLLTVTSCSPRLRQVTGNGVELDSRRFADLGIVPKGLDATPDGYTIDISLLLEEETDEQPSDDNGEVADGYSVSIVDLLEQMGIKEDKDKAETVKTPTNDTKTADKKGKKDRKKKKDKKEKQDTPAPAPTPSQPTTQPVTPTQPATQTQTAATTGNKSSVSIKCDNVWTLKLKEWADTWIGVPYLFGGTTRKGIDCSGFTGELYRNVFEIQLQRNSRAQYSQDCYTTVKGPNLQLGDLVFFVTNGKAAKSDNISHVGVYVGEQIFVHSSSSKGVVYSRLTDAYWTKTFLIGGRVIRFK